MTEPVSVRIHHSTRPSKKLMAVFTLENARTRTVHFGVVGASDFTQHHDPARKQRYLARHAPREAAVGAPEAAAEALSAEAGVAVQTSSKASMQPIAQTHH